jgi:molybdopterin-guanine dinucleotide biosynthesis protein A
MGQDKALMDLHGKPLLGWVIERLREVNPPIGEIFIVGDRPAYHQFGVPVLADAYPGTGALGGIASAIARSSTPHVFVTACDMPFLSVRLLRAMLSVDRDYDVLVPRTTLDRDAGGFDPSFEPLHAVYGKRCMPAIQERLQRGELKVTGFFNEVELRTLEETWLRQFDPTLRSFLNLNRVDDFISAAGLAKTFLEEKAH